MIVDYVDDFAKSLRIIRCLLGITAKEFAEIFDMVEPTVTRIERNETMTKVQYLAFVIAIGTLNASESNPIVRRAVSFLMDNRVSQSDKEELRNDILKSCSKYDKRIGMKKYSDNIRNSGVLERYFDEHKNI